ncbi:MAG: cadmium-translocating P-type ATPase [Lachnospiraceae bacterium]|nr:cadmium-translocating P-type ATPase [Lachnospiraceae bacterium]
MTKKLKKRIKRLCIGVVPFVLAIILSIIHLPIGEKLNQYLIFGLFLLAYLMIGGDVVKTAVVNVAKGQVFDENFLMTLASVGAFFVGEAPEAVAVMLFYQVGECFQSYAVNRSRKSITDLMNIKPDYAVVIRDGKEVEIDPSEAKIGEVVLVKPGEKIPLDGTIIEGSTALDTVALTGESVPQDAMIGDLVLSGCVNISGVIKFRVEKEYDQSTVAKILELVENATDKKSKSENFISKFARYYTPAVVISAVLLAIIPPVILSQDFKVWIYRALTFLVTSCPCALVISIPLSFFGGIGGASRAGILVKGSNYIETISKVNTAVMDKTGTLTKGVFAVQNVVPVKGKKKEEVLRLAAYAEAFSNHPIAVSLKEAFGKEVDCNLLSNVEELAGFGIKATFEENELLAGNYKLMQKENISCEKASESGTLVYVAYNKEYFGYIVIADEVKADAKEAIDKMKACGIKKIVMLTGDNEVTAKEVAEKLDILEYHAGLLPQDKVRIFEEIMTNDDNVTAFVGDGINDAPVLARADVGIAMGGLGSDAAIEAADIVIMNDEPSKIAKMISISKKTLAIVKENIVFAIGIKVAILILAAIGIANMWLAVFADVGVAALAILNAMRTLKSVD